mmetsp:Transcript_52952/g.162998  ORF Transcript_52952/g.162998 Transcript_52952/m.162998 type:complete len:247 (-) Transcript_52952:412-1152(-)
MAAARYSGVELAVTSYARRGVSCSAPAHHWRRCVRKRTATDACHTSAATTVGSGTSHGFVAARSASDAKQKHWRRYKGTPPATTATPRTVVDTTMSSPCRWSRWKSGRGSKWAFITMLATTVASTSTKVAHRKLKPFSMLSGPVATPAVVVVVVAVTAPSASMSLAAPQPRGGALAPEASSAAMKHTSAMTMLNSVKDRNRCSTYRRLSATRWACSRCDRYRRISLWLDTMAVFVGRRRSPLAVRL